MTCLANDIGYDHVFSYVLGRLAIAGDALIIFPRFEAQNIIEAAQKSSSSGVKIVGFVGFDGGDLLSLCDIAVHVPINDMQIVEDLHMIVGHWLIRRIKAANLMSKQKIFSLDQDSSAIQSFRDRHKRFKIGFSSWNFRPFSLWPSKVFTARC